MFRRNRIRARIESNHMESSGGVGFGVSHLPGRWVQDGDRCVGDTRACQVSNCCRDADVHLGIQSGDRHKERQAQGEEEQRCKSLLTIFPKDPTAWHIPGLLPENVGSASGVAEDAPRLAWEQCFHMDVMLSTYHAKFLFNRLAMLQA